jgi:hypothetical protein
MPLARDERGCPLLKSLKRAILASNPPGILANIGYCRVSGPIRGATGEQPPAVRPVGLSSSAGMLHCCSLILLGSPRDTVNQTQI